MGALGLARSGLGNTYPAHGLGAGNLLASRPHWVGSGCSDLPSMDVMGSEHKKQHDLNDIPETARKGQNIYFFIDFFVCPQYNEIHH